MTPQKNPDRAEIVALDKRYVWHPYTPMQTYLDQTDPIVVARAEGPFFWDVDGTRYIDSNGSWWLTTLGHGHPRILAALSAQAAALCHTSLAGCTHEPAARLGAELCALAPGANDATLADERRLSKIFFSDNGSTAVEVAIKMAAQYWAQNGRPKRTRFVTFADAFHGETIGATSVGGIDAFRTIFALFLFDVITLPAPTQNNWTQVIDKLASVLREGGDHIAAVIVEPLVQGAAGMQMSPPAFLTALRRLTQQADTFLIADEVFVGLGRTGTLFACEQGPIVPDLLCLAKALSGGLFPFAATLCTKRLFDGFLGEGSRALYYGHSYCGNPLGTAVARAVLSVIADEDVLGHVRALSPLIAERFSAMAPKSHRTLGMIGALDLGPVGYFGQRGKKVAACARRRGIYLRPLGDTLYIAPPLTIPRPVLEELLDGLAESITESNLL